MKFFRLLFISTILVSLNPVFAQNLFPNGGFEQYTQCPTYTSQIDRCTGWDSCLGTADFYHCNYYASSTLGDYGIPATGDGVIGLIANVPGAGSPWPGRFYGETFSAPLAKTLEPGATYKLQADILYNTVQWPPPGNCLDVGFYFYKSDNPPFYPSQPPGTNQYKAMIGISASLIPVASYGTFNFTYTPDSCYDRVMIGLFQNDSTFGAGCYAASSSFYFDIDNISMIQTATEPFRITTAVSNLQNICFDDCIEFNVNSNLPVYTWNWSFPGAATSTSSEQSPSSICYPAQGNYDVSLITTFECDADTILLEDYIHVNAPPVLEIQYDTSIFCFGNTLNLYTVASDPVYWSNGSSDNSIAVKDPGTYIAISENECGITSDTAAIGFENCSCTVYLPNAFTPDQDGTNDQFKAEGECFLEDFQLNIYDRWGKRIFTSADINSAWDGKVDGMECPQGVYGVTLTYKGYTDYRLNKVTQSGYVVVLR